MQPKYYILLALVFLTSCTYFYKQEDDRVPIARVNESYLYHDDIKDLIKEDAISKEDSIVKVTNFINRWATQQLLVAGAERNLAENTQNEFNKLAKEYKNDLYATAYLEALVARSIDTVVTQEEAKAYYDENKEIFKLNEDLVKFRYINIDENRLDFSQVKEQFKRYNNKDKRTDHEKGQDK